MTHELTDRRDLMATMGGLIALTLALATGAAIGKLTPVAVLVPLVIAGGFLLGRRAPFAALVTLFAAVSFERYNVTLLPGNRVNIRLDEVIALAVVLGLGLRLYRQGDLWTKLRQIPALVPLGAFLLENLLSTLLNHHNLSKGADFLLILIAGSVCYAELTLLAEEIRAPRAILRAILSIGVIEALYGLVMFAISLAFNLGAITGVQIEPNTGYLEPYGTAYEGNIYGHYVGALLVLAGAVALALWARKQLFSGLGRLVLAGAAILLVGLIASLARGAWLGVIAGAGVALGLAWRYQDAATRSRGAITVTPPHITTRQALIGAGALAALIVVFFVSHADQIIGSRLTNLFQVQQGTGLVRSQNTAQALADWVKSPIIGRGNGSFNQYLDPLNGVKPWILSMGVSILHDSGLLGVGLYLWYLWSLTQHLLAAARQYFTPEAKAILFGAAGAAVVMLVGAQATNTLYLLVLWFFLGLAAAAPVMARQFTPPPTAPATPSAEPFDATHKRLAGTR